MATKSWAKKTNAAPGKLGAKAPPAPVKKDKPAPAKATETAPPAAEPAPKAEPAPAPAAAEPAAPAPAEPAPAPKREKMAEEGKARATSNVFAKLSKKTMQEMKEAFTMIDGNRDGIIDIEDLKDMYSNLGRIPPDAELNEMLKEATGPINFTMFLNLFGEKLSGTDPEDTIKQAFSMFDSDGKGFIGEDYLKDLLSNMGDNFTPEEIKQTWKEAPLEKGKFDYNTFTGILKGKEEEEPQQ